jgi:hypothetical protein
VTVLTLRGGSPPGGDRFLVYAYSESGRLWVQKGGRWEPTMRGSEQICPRCDFQRRNRGHCDLCLSVGWLDEDGLPPDDLRYLPDYEAAAA